MADGFHLVQIRARAQHWRELLKEETDPRRISQYRQLAEALEQEADAIDRFRDQRAALQLRLPSHWRSREMRETG
jgi:hypothetical protein